MVVVFFGPLRNNYYFCGLVIIPWGSRTYEKMLREAIKE